MKKKIPNQIISIKNGTFKSLGVGGGEDKGRKGERGRGWSLFYEREGVK